VDDFAGQEDLAIGEAPPRLVGVIDGAVDAIAEAELVRQMHREAAGCVAIAVGLDRLDEAAVVVGRERAGDGVLEVEALAVNDCGLARRHLRL
jgi:hypothetical protein